MTYLAIFLFISAGIFATAYLGIPGDVRDLIKENCRGSSGRFRIRYVIRECVAVCGFYAQFIFVIVPLACFVALACLAVDRHIRLDLVGSGLSQFHVDAEVWQENLSTGPNSVKEGFKNYHLSQGGTESGARQLMRLFWIFIPFAFFASLLSVILFLRVMSDSYNIALERLVKRGVATDLRRVRRRYLRSSAQSQNVKVQHKQSPADQQKRVVV